MSTLAEIEAAVDQLPPEQKEEFVAFLLTRLGRLEPVADDPVTEIIGAFAGTPGATGRQAEAILYGRGETA